ncbi:MAG: LPS export ABC transporter periplasmic protein LptC [Ignavibacteria bacterium]|nr:LPS export ABC transporter periplasmic protein LptC [Ignavibacteria bacterium]
MYIKTLYKKEVFGLILVLTTLCISCGTETEQKFKPEVQMKLEQAPDQLAKNLVVEFLDSSFLRAKLWAKVGKVFYQQSETWLYDSIKVEFYSRKTGKRQSVLTADSAKINDRTKDMYAYGKVVVVADSPKTILRTSFLEWRNKVQRLYSNEYIEIVTPQEEIRGFGFESDLNLTNYKIYRVSGVRK